jgi:hypothetical protein
MGLLPKLKKKLKDKFHRKTKEKKRKQENLNRDSKLNESSQDVSTTMNPITDAYTLTKLHRRNEPTSDDDSSSGDDERRNHGYDDIGADDEDDDVNGVLDATENLRDEAQQNVPE